MRYIDNWQCPFCRTVHRRIETSAVADAAKFQDCPSCDYFNPLYVAPLEVIYRISEAV